MSNQMWIALVGLIGGLLTGALAGSFSARAALNAWRRSRRDMVANKAVELIQQLSTDLAGLSHCAMWLTWRARSNPTSFDPKYLERYENDTYEKVPRLLGNLAALAAINDHTANALHPFVDEICKLDGEIAHASIDARSAKIEKLGALYERSKDCYEDLLSGLSCRAAQVMGKE